MYKIKHNQTEILFLCFHYLKRDDDYKRILGHSFDVFEKYIDFLETHYPIISFQDLDSFLLGNKELPPRCSLLFFDDGLAEHARIIAPYLANRNISAIFSPPTCIFNQEMTDVQIIHFVTAKYGISRFYQFLKQYFLVTNLKWEDYFSVDLERLDLLLFYGKLKRILLHELPFKTSKKLLQKIYKEVLLKDDPDIFDKVYFNQQELKQLPEMGHFLGCHTSSHFSFSHRELDKHDWYKEVNESKKILESIIKRPVEIFVYPYGGLKDQFDFVQWTNKLKDAGFRYSFNTYRQYSGNHHFEPYWVERYAVQSQDSIEDIVNKTYKYHLINKK